MTFVTNSFSESFKVLNGEGSACRSRFQYGSKIQGFLLLHNRSQLEGHEKVPISTLAVVHILSQSKVLTFAPVLRNQLSQISDDRRLIPKKRSKIITIVSVFKKPMKVVNLILKLLYK